MEETPQQARSRLMGEKMDRLVDLTVTYAEKRKKESEEKQRAAMLNRFNATIAQGKAKLELKKKEIKRKIPTMNNEEQNLLARGLVQFRNSKDKYEDILGLFEQQFPNSKFTESDFQTYEKDLTIQILVQLQESEGTAVPFNPANKKTKAMPTKLAKALKEFPEGTVNRLFLIHKNYFPTYSDHAMHYLFKEYGVPPDKITEGDRQVMKVALYLIPSTIENRYVKIQKQYFTNRTFVEVYKLAQQVEEEGTAVPSNPAEGIAIPSNPANNPIPIPKLNEDLFINNNDYMGDSKGEWQVGTGILIDNTMTCEKDPLYCSEGDIEMKISPEVNYTYKPVETPPTTSSIVTVSDIIKTNPEWLIHYYGKRRQILIQLAEVSHSLYLSRESWYKAVEILDIFMYILPMKYQKPSLLSLFALSCLFISSSINETANNNINDYLEMDDKSNWDDESAKDGVYIILASINWKSLGSYTALKHLQKFFVTQPDSIVYKEASVWLDLITCDSQLCKLDPYSLASVSLFMATGVNSFLENQTMLVKNYTESLKPFVNIVKQELKKIVDNSEFTKTDISVLNNRHKKLYKSIIKGLKTKEDSFTEQEKNEIINKPIDQKYIQYLRTKIGWLLTLQDINAIIPYFVQEQNIHFLKTSLPIYKDKVHYKVIQTLHETEIYMEKGQVYLCRDLTNGGTIVKKTTPITQDCIREITSLTQLSPHPNLISIIACSFDFKNRQVTLYFPYYGVTLHALWEAGFYRIYVNKFQIAKSCIKQLLLGKKKGCCPFQPEPAALRCSY